MSPFDFTKQIEHGKKNLIDENPELEREYKPFIINRALSFSHDMVLYANLMNDLKQKICRIPDFPAPRNSIPGHHNTAY